MFMFELDGFPATYSLQTFFCVRTMKMHHATVRNVTIKWNDEKYALHRNVHGLFLWRVCMRVLSKPSVPNSNRTIWAPDLSVRLEVIFPVINALSKNE